MYAKVCTLEMRACVCVCKREIREACDENGRVDCVLNFV